MKPTLQLLPLRAAVTHDRTIALEVLAQITALLDPSQNRPACPPTRPPLNLALVLDRSGSMAGKKLDYAKRAACLAVEQLLPSDRISFTIFDDRVQTLIPSTLATNKACLLDTIQQVEPGGCTALHDGWVQGGLQVSQHLNDRSLNRIILISDGLANEGETRREVIAQNVRGLSQRGVSTTTMGLGRDYDEDLLAVMASNGDGNFVHIESPKQLPDFFATELRGLMATLGRRVSLGIQPQGQVALDKVLNELEKTEFGNWMLPNLTSNNTIPVVFRLVIPPQTHSQALVSVRLAWDEPDSGTLGSPMPGRQDLYAILSLPVISGAAWDALPIDQLVQRQVLILEAAIARGEAIRALDIGDRQAAAQVINKAYLQTISGPPSPVLDQEIAELELLHDTIDSDASLARKQARSQSYRSHRGGTSQ
jgi:Ca-activated chloride channel homolog